MHSLQYAFVEIYLPFSILISLAILFHATIKFYHNLLFLFYNCTSVHFSLK